MHLDFFGIRLNLLAQQQVKTEDRFLFIPIFMNFSLQLFITRQASSANILEKMSWWKNIGRLRTEGIREGR